MVKSKKLAIKTRKGKFIRQFSFTKIPDGFTLQEMNSKVKRVVQQLRDRNIYGRISVVPLLKDGKKSWISSRTLELNKNFNSVEDLTNDAIIYYHLSRNDVNNNEKYLKFRVYLFPTNKYGGSDDEHNDCLFRAIRNSFNGLFPYFNNPKTPESLKCKLGLGRNDMVPIDLIPKVEDIYKTNITVYYGEQIYNGVNKFERNIQLRLNNEHYQLILPDRVKDPKLGGKMKFWRGFNNYSTPYNKKNKRIPCSYYIDNINGKFYYYNPEYCPGYTDKDGRQIYLDLENSESDIFTDDGTFFERKIYKWHMVPAENKEVLKQTYNKYIQRADEIKNLSNNWVDIYNRGSDNETALYNWQELSKFIETPEDWIDREQQWISNAMTGGLIHAELGTYNNCKKYDVCSFYPSIMKNQNVRFPYHAGTFKTIDSLTFHNVRFGIYRAEITGNINPKLFRLNSENYYTSYDIMSAFDLGYTVNLIKDGCDNFLFYPKNACKTAKTLFNNFIYRMFTVKRKTPEVKPILNCLWGTLCQKSSKMLTLKTDSEYQIPDNYDILSVVPFGENFIKLRLYDPVNIYKYRYARMGPFLTSYGRYRLCHDIKDIADSIVQIHTDGFIVKDITPKNIKIGTDIGDYKLEKTGTCNIKHVNDVDWE